MNLRRSIQVLARETPASLRRFVKRVFVPAFLLRYLYPASPPKRRRAKRRRARSPAYPARAVRHPDGLEIAFRAIPYSDFFEDAFTHRTLARVRRKLTRRFFPIPPAPIDAMPEGAPAGIIFHVGRCGSTLVCELLKRIRGVAVYSEPFSVDDVLVPPNAWTPEEIVAGLRLMGSLFAEHAGGRYVWKLRGGNTLFCELFLRAFPQTPWIFCVRDPLEVAVTRLKDHPHWLQPFGEPLNPFLPYIIDGQDKDVSFEVYIASAFGAFCRAISKADWTRGILVKYQDLPDAVLSTVAPHFGLAIDPPEREAMAERARLHSKARYGESTAFSPDVLQKQSSASEEMKSAVDLYARPALADLLALRQEPS